MKFAALIVLSLSALALAGPAFNKQQQQQSVQTGSQSQTEAILKKWCSSTEMSQEQLTGSFKELVQAVKVQPEEQSSITEQNVMNERICQQQQQQQQQSSSEPKAIAESKVHDYIKDVYMDALIACDSQQCMKQLNRIISSHEVDSIRASYYMTRLALSDSIGVEQKDDNEEQVIVQAEAFIQSPKKTSVSVERQQMLAATSLIGKHLKNKQQQQTSQEVKKIAQQVAITIVNRYIKPVSQQDVKQYQTAGQQQQQLTMKIAKRNAALKALANLPGWLIAELSEVQQICLEIAQNKDEQVTARQSAIECLEECPACQQQLKQLTFDQEQPIEVRVAAYRALMTCFNGEQEQQATATTKQQAEKIVKQIVEHCEESRNQQEDDQFVLYVISHLENLSTSQQPEHETLVESIKGNKQMNMKIQLLNKKFKRALGDVRKSSRNYKLEQQFNQLESGLIIEGDLIYESKHWSNQQQQVLPKLIRVNMSMPIMGETVNVLEVSVRQNHMDEQFLSALKLAGQSGNKFTSGESVGKLMDSFKSTVNSNKQQQQSEQQSEADLSIKVDGCTIVYLCAEDFKQETSGRQRNTRSSNSIVDDIIEHLKRKPISFNRGFNFQIDERIAKLLDLEASLIAGLRFESRASGQSANDFEIQVQAEPRFAMETLVGPASERINKKLLQRLSTKTALGMRLRFKRDQLVDIELDLPTQSMELFTIESKIVEQTPSGQYVDVKESPMSQLLKLAKKNNKQSSIFGGLMSQLSDKSSGMIDENWQMSEQLARAIGLRGQLRVVAKSSGLMMQAVCQKYEPTMQGYRVQVQRIAPTSSNNNQEQYLWTLTTPGAQIDRTMKVRLSKQSSSGRSGLKAEIKTPKGQFVAVWELVRDGRQYGLKVEMASVRSSTGSGSQWRHQFACGVQTSNSVRFGTYKPYLVIKSTELRRPVEMQGTITVQEEPKFVITYQMRSSQNSENFIQGKLIVDQRSSSSPVSRRRSMRSPVELVLERDLTLTKELLVQFEKVAIKAHTMIDWDSSKSSLSCDSSLLRKNLFKQTDESHYQVQLKLNGEQQLVSVERKCTEEPRKNYRVAFVAGYQSPKTHQVQFELKYHGKRQQQQPAIVFYKQQVELKQVSGNKIELVGQVEIVSSEHQISEKLQARAQIGNERKLKSIHTELMSGRNGDKLCKLDVDFVSFAEHQIELLVKLGQHSQHQYQVSVHSDRRQFEVQSRLVDNRYNKQTKMELQYEKQTSECKIVFDCEKKQVHIVLDLKPVSGKQSQVIVQSPLVQSKAEFFFESMMPQSLLGLNGKSLWSLSGLKPLSQLRFKSDVRDMLKKEAYWMDSHWTRSPSSKSFLRMDSPIYRTDIEYDPTNEETKFGVFARSKRSVFDSSNINDYSQQIYSSSPADETFDWSSELSQKLNGAQGKMWMIRSLVSSPSQLEQLKQKARRALFEFADQRQSQKHTFQYEPTKGINFELERKPINQQQQLQAMRLKGDLNVFNENQQDMRPSTISMDSDMLDFDFESKPFFGGLNQENDDDTVESYAKFNVQSRYPRSTFKHDSEFRYKKDQGYKAHMKHEDKQGKRHSWSLEADDEPQRFAKMSFDSEKHGKVDAEYNWRKHLTSSNNKNKEQVDDVYANRVAFKAQGPRREFFHESELNWIEPATTTTMMKKHHQQRERRSVFDQSRRRYDIVDYLKHVKEARLNSRSEQNQNELYNVDFDYKPESHARLSVQMPDEMLHQSSLEFQPTYKLQSKLYNRRTQKPTYELIANTKPVAGLATASQEPVFVDYEHSILEQPIISANQRDSGLFASLFKQPLRVDYTDMFGRVANVDYDFAPITQTSTGESRQLYAGLRQKRAAVYYKDQEQDFEHSSTYDFYPETVFGQVKPSKRIPGDVVVKAQTKYGPIVLHADSNGQQVELKVETPVMDADLSCEFKGHQGAKLFKINLDNKQQRVKLAKIVRKVPILEDIELIKELAEKIDSTRFEHESQLLVNYVSSILKLKSETKMDERQVMLIDAEFNQQLEKAFIKIDGQRINGQAIVDLANKTAELVLDVDDKRTIQHRTRFVRISKDFYGMDSMTSYKSKPIIKLNGKICANIFDSQSHFSARRHSGQQQQQEQHISTFEAVIYGTKRGEPKQISGQYDCLEKEARVIYKDLAGRRVSDVRINYDDQTENVFVVARTTGQNGTTKQIQKSINISPLVEAY